MNNLLIVAIQIYKKCLSTILKLVSDSAVMAIVIKSFKYRSIIQNRDCYSIESSLTWLVYSWVLGLGRLFIMLYKMSSCWILYYYSNKLPILAFNFIDFELKGTQFRKRVILKHLLSLNTFFTAFFNI